MPVGDHEALAGAVIDMLADEDRRLAMGAKARAWTEAHDGDWTAAAFVDIYEELTRGGSHHA